MIPAISAVSEDTTLNVSSLKSLEAQLSLSPERVKYLTFSHSDVLEGFEPLVEFRALYINLENCFKDTSIGENL